MCRVPRIFVRGVSQKKKTGEALRKTSLLSPLGGVEIFENEEKMGRQVEAVSHIQLGWPMLVLTIVLPGLPAPGNFLRT